MVRHEKGDAPFKKGNEMTKHVIWQFRRIIVQISAVLILYLLNVLKFTESQSTIFFNSFTVLCYLTPLLGSIIADGYIGKFWTIFFVSILYACGQVILAVASINNKESSIHPWMDLAGLIIIGFGTGGIKPCVSAFGGDQFEIGQDRMLSLFFSMFYFSINAGSMISTFISPIFRCKWTLAAVHFSSAITT
ncbi:unnamed protein product [Haemonchus placei]|uniref:MFS domain-containing protein n=1 Tax=Haemonchus placei TaxID=6290 RepID=A0A0N4WTP6_HAEPC|nr:unnamed protein product [Haemonchus placei]